MPASEIVIWKEYFNDIPFTQEQEDRRTALLASTIASMSGKTLKNPLQPDVFLKYLDASKFAPKEQSVAEQVVKALAFREKLKP